MENSKWRVEVRGGGQIADTGDYSDPFYVLTNGTIELVTKDELNEEDISHLNHSMNAVHCKWEDWKLSDKEYELHLEKENCKKWKEAAAHLYLAVKSSDIDPKVACLRYEQTLNNLP